MQDGVLARRGLQDLTLRSVQGNLGAIGILATELTTESA